MEVPVERIVERIVERFIEAPADSSNASPFKAGSSVGEEVRTSNDNLPVEYEPKQNLKKSVMLDEPDEGRRINSIKSSGSQPISNLLSSNEESMLLSQRDSMAYSQDVGQRE